MRSLEFIREGDKYIAEFLLLDFMDTVGSFGVPTRVEVREKEINGIASDPTVIIVESKEARIAVKIGPYYLRSFHKLPFWRRLVVKWWCFMGVE